MNVYILATVRKPELVDAALMVFQTLRTGFPTWPVKVFLNDPMDLESRKAVLSACKEVGAGTAQGLKTIHHEWIGNLISTAVEPFVLCDTDMAFWKSVEDFPAPKTIRGRLIPQWKDEFTKCVTRPRLHTSLLFVDAIRVRTAVEKYRDQFPVTPFNPGADLIYPVYHPLNRESYFYDTCGLLYHAIGGEAFSEAELECYDHLNFGTIGDIVTPFLTGGHEMALARLKAFKWPTLAKGCWRFQEKYYAERFAK